MPRKIDDHAFFAGGKSKDSVLPKGVHSKPYSSCGGGGELKEYYDTSPKIKERQDHDVRKMNSQKQPAMDRN